MKKVSILFLAVLITAGISLNAFGQSDKSKRPSPPMTASGEVGDLKIVIDYGAPYVKGRTIFGSGDNAKEAYGKVWRTGANEATTFSVNKNVTIDGNPLPAGKYALFTIPEANEWTVIFNKEPEQWGAYDYDQSEDALRIKVKPEKPSALQEQLMFEVGGDGQVTFAWENVTFDFNVNAN